MCVCVSVCLVCRVSLGGSGGGSSSASASARAQDCSVCPFKSETFPFLSLLCRVGDSTYRPAPKYQPIRNTLCSFSFSDASLSFLSCVGGDSPPRDTIRHSQLSNANSVRETLRSSSEGPISSSNLTSFCLSDHVTVLHRSPGEYRPRGRRNPHDEGSGGRSRGESLRR